MIPGTNFAHHKEACMEKIVDTRGLACPEPVILTKKALEEAKEVLVIADNDEAVENIRRLANKMGCAIDRGAG